jgi:hypothetical protein
MSRREYVQQNPDLMDYAQFMYPSVAQRIGIKNKFIIFPRDFDSSNYSPYELRRFGTIHNNAIKMYELGFGGHPSFDPRFLNGNVWKLRTGEVPHRARTTMKRALQRNNTKSRMSRRVDARKKLRNSKHFKLWREHVRYKPSGSGYNAANSTIH